MPALRPGVSETRRPHQRPNQQKIQPSRIPVFNPILLGPVSLGLVLLCEVLHLIPHKT